MCGIFAYLNHQTAKDRKDILEVLFNGLRRLEYRGYDSAGISVDSDWTARDQIWSDVPPPLVFRQQGKIEALVQSVYKG